ncbi:phosphonate metabolism protein/1,5-bisphosphokinase (PRPP-forming) PhnN [Acidovorax sp.]|uniref:phosphonate metabolism protein/1,5-bisphosphokinase (PRPP-forming) PhnN n=1 Tax=Acidovorax sp. TaxID=1872122 RepID=UPI002ACEDF6C|nr:phosphonate metabolism protein/1,5-bisphosphokinase (PRPP-forming) PhnN [Acidovorax sp.]MDZ7864578.1 phosphonate metabolism protein/1,5-bisphosphokinase (PRPP-forming) PhnN [Acidovorax sp.]
MSTTAQLLYFMGPSGAGKDSLLDWLRQHLPAGLPVQWARRTISRPASPGGEAHESTTPDAHAALRAAGAFALHWEANGLAYGVRHAEMAPLVQGRWLMVNGSRAYLPEALARYPDLVAVHITASPEVLRQRLQSRGRENADEVEQRVQRALRFLAPPGTAGIEVRNDTSLDAAGRQLLQALERLPGWPGLVSAPAG